MQRPCGRVVLVSALAGALWLASALVPAYAQENRWGVGTDVGFVAGTVHGTVFNLGFNVDYYLDRNFSVGPMMQITPTGDLFQISFAGVAKYHLRLDNGINERSVDPGVPVEIEAVLGLDFDQFTRAILLAQGNFAAFLKATPAEQADLLEKMTGTEIYQQIGEVAPNPAFIQNRCTTFLATNIRPTGTTAFGEHENIRIRLHPRSELDQLLRTGEISHALVIAAIQWMRLAGY